MSRMLGGTIIGGIVGFVVFYLMFRICARHAGEELLWLVFSVMAALPSALIGLIFTAVSVVREELAQVRQELMRWQKIEKLLANQEEPSTHFKPGLPREL